MEWLILVLTLCGLAVGGDHFVASASAIGKRLGMNPVLIGATIVAFGTSLPEWGVSVSAAWRGLTDLSAGNVVGSNVCNVALILGLSALVLPLRVTRDALYRDGTMMLIATALFIFFAFSGEITRTEGALLLVVGLVATIASIIWQRDGDDQKTLFHWWDVPRAIFALALVLVSSHYFVNAAELIARNFGISEWIIGLTIAAIGTSLPELATSLAAVKKNEPGMLIGGLLGSNTFNILFVMGTAASINPMSGANFPVIDAAIFAGLMIIVVGFLWTGMKVSRLEGGILFALGLVWYAFNIAK